MEPIRGLTRRVGDRRCRRRGRPRALLVASKVTKAFEGLVANRDIDFDIPRHSIVSIIGPNGAGKTTFFNQLTGIYAPTSGSITFDDVEISGMAPHDVAELGIARTYQNIRLFQNMTVLANVMVGAPRPDAIAVVPRDPAAGRASARRRRSRSSEPASCSSSSASGGRSSRTSRRTFPMATSGASRSLARWPADPSLLLLDEPTAGMNPGETSQMTDFIARLRRDLQLTILLIEHDMKVVMGVSERITVLDYGEMIAEGTPEEIRTNPRVIEAYLGTQAQRHEPDDPRARRRPLLLRQHPRPQGRVADRGRGRDRDPDRLERGRQDHHAAHDQRHRRPREGAIRSNELAIHTCRRTRS